MINHDYYCTECDKIVERSVESKDLDKPVYCNEYIDYGHRDDGPSFEECGAELVRIFIKLPAMKMKSGGTRAGGIR